MRVFLWVNLALLVLLVPACSKQSKKVGYLQRAEAFFKAGNYDPAEIEYKNVLRLDPTNHAAIRNLGMMCFDQGRIPQSYALLTQAKTDNPEDLEARLRLATLQLAGGAATNARQEALLLTARQPTNELFLMLLVDSSFTTNELRDAEQRLAGFKSAGDSVGHHLATGILKLRNGDRAGGEAEFRQALQLNPKSSAAHAAIANLYLLRNDRTNAEVAFRTAADNSPPRSGHRMRYLEFQFATGQANAAKQSLVQMVKATPDYLPAVLKLAQVALAERRMQDCERMLRSVQSRDPLHLEAMLLLAQMHLAKNEPSRAITELERALKTYSKLPQIHYQLAIAHLVQNDLPGAIKRLNAALALQPDFPEAVLMLAELNIRRADPTSAINALARLVAQRPKFTRAQLLLAGAYQARAGAGRTSKDLAEALKIYEDLSRSFPTNPEPALLGGVILRQQGRSADARQRYETALSFAPDYLPALEQLVQMDLTEKDFTGAKARLEKEIARRPTLAAPQVLLASVHLAETNLNAAEAMLHQAIKLEPEYRPAHSLLAHVYVSANKHQEALRQLGEMVTHNTNDIVSLQQIAELNAVASNYVAARDTYERLLLVNSKYFPALNNLAWLYSEHLNDPKRAYDLASRAHDMAPDDPATSDTFGWVLYRNRDYPRALALVQFSASKLPGQPEILYHLGMVHYRMGEEAAAKVALQSALQLSRQEAWRSEAQARLRILEIDAQSADAKTVIELQTSLQRDAEDPILLTRLAQVAAREGNWKEAASKYEKALVTNDHLVPVMVALGRIYANHLNDPQRAMILARQARTLEPDDPVIAHTLGRLAFESARSPNDFQWAFSLLQESLSKLPKDPRVLFDYALASYAAGRVDSAAEAMRRAVALELPPVLTNDAGIFLRMQTLQSDPNLAVANAGEVADLIHKEPNHLAALVTVAVIQERKGNHADARDNYEKVLKLAPLFAPANRALAGLYFNNLKDPQRAFDHAMKAREVFPQDTRNARILGVLSYQRSEFSSAAMLLKESAAKYPEDSEILYCLGLSQFKLKQTGESKNNLTKALAMAPNSALAPEAKRVLAEIK